MIIIFRLVPSLSKKFKKHTRHFSLTSGKNKKEIEEKNKNLEQQQKQKQPSKEAEEVTAKSTTDRTGNKGSIVRSASVCGIANNAGGGGGAGGAIQRKKKEKPLEQEIVVALYNSIISCIFVPTMDGVGYYPQKLLTLLRKSLRINESAHDNFIVQAITICNFEVCIV